MRHRKNPDEIVHRGLASCSQRNTQPSAKAGYRYFVAKSNGDLRARTMATTKGERKKDEGRRKNRGRINARSVAGIQDVYKYRRGRSTGLDPNKGE